MRTISSSGSSATARACGCASHSSFGRTMPAGSPAAFSASSRSCAFHVATAAAMDSRVSSQPMKRTWPAWWWGMFAWIWIHRPSAVG